jgi:hypothetical protein
MVLTTRRSAVGRRAAGVLLGLAAALALWLGAADAANSASRPKTSRPYRITVSFELSSPRVPDGRSSVGELAFRVVFSPVVFQFDPSEDPLLGRCQIETGTARGVFTRFALNDVEKDGVRLTPAFLTPRPAGFTAGIGIESEPMAEDEAVATSRVAPARVRLSFWTDFGAKEIKWGSELGINVLRNLRIVFEAPFRDLLAGRPRAVTVPYEGVYPEDKGTWKIEFVPESGKR